MAEHKAPVWWGIPKRLSESVAERKISWLELFSDLVYAGAISQLTDHLAHHPDMSSVRYVAFVFALIYWAWLNGANYHDLHGTPGVRSRLTTLWQMMSMAAVAVTIPEVFEGHYTGFAISFAVLQGIITYLWWSTGFYDPSHTVLNRWYVFNYSVSFILLIISIFTPAYITGKLWAVVLVLDYSAPILSSRRIKGELAKRQQSFSMSNAMIERFGLLTMIVLGEGLLGIIHGMGECSQTTGLSWICFVLSILIVFLLWWIYFDLLGESQARKGFSASVYVSFGYLPLIFAFAVIGASMRIMLADTGGTSHPLARNLMGFSIAIILFSTILISRAMEQDAAEERAMRRILWLVLMTSILVAFLTAIGSILSISIFLALISVTLLGSIALAFRIWLGYGLFSAD